jgi:hypothetical protein
MRKIIDRLMQLGNTEGMTFRARHEDGVGMFIEPNPALTRSQLGIVELPPPTYARRVLYVPPRWMPRVTSRRASGEWSANPWHVA